MIRDSNDLRLDLPHTGVLTLSEPEIPQKSQKGLSGPGARSVKEVSKKSKTTLKKSEKGVKISFRHFFGTPGGEAREDVFETFGDFGAQTPAYGDCSRNSRLNLLEQSVVHLEPLQWEKNTHLETHPKRVKIKKFKIALRD